MSALQRIVNKLQSERRQGLALRVRFRKVLLKTNVPVKRDETSSEQVPSCQFLMICSLRSCRILKELSKQLQNFTYGISLHIFLSIYSICDNNSTRTSARELAIGV